MFAIVMMDDNQKIVSVCRYDPDRGYTMTRQRTDSVIGASFFETRDEAQSAYDSMRSEKPNVYPGGLITPPSHIWTGLNINDHNPKASGHFNIVQMAWDVVHSTPVEGEIKHPTGFTY